MQHTHTSEAKKKARKMVKCFPFSLISFRVFSSCCRLHEIIIVFSSHRRDSKTFNFLFAGGRPQSAVGEERPAIIPSGYFCRQMALRVSNSLQNLFAPSSQLPRCLSLRDLQNTKKKEVGEP